MMALMHDSVLMPVQQDTMSSLAYTALRSALLRREFEPEEQLDLPAISRRMRISLTPLKEALRRLDDERLVEIRPRQGTYVRAVTVERLREVTQARILIELWGVEEFRATDAQWRDVDDLVVQSEELARAGLDDVVELEDRFATLDHAFHRAILGAAGNEPITRFFDSLGAHVLLARAWCLEPDVLLRKQVQSGVSEHRRIFEVLRSGDRAAAALLMREHIERSLNGACAIVDAHGGRI
jgi:DNA-binding GntR family transcriptional regulator